MLSRGLICGNFQLEARDRPHYGGLDCVCNNGGTQLTGLLFAAAKRGWEGSRPLVFHVQQSFFAFHAAGIAREASIGSDNPVAGDYQGDGVMPHGTANGLRRHGRNAFGACHL